MRKFLFKNIALFFSGNCRLFSDFNKIKTKTLLVFLLVFIAFCDFAKAKPIKQFNVLSKEHQRTIAKIDSIKHSLEKLNAKQKKIQDKRITPGYKTTETGARYFPDSLVTFIHNDTVSGSYLKSSKTVYTSYDSDGRITSFVSYYWDGSVNTWMKASSGFYDYDANGNYTKFQTYEWFDFTSEWEGDIYYTAQYDDMGHQKQNTYYNWDGDNWVNTALTTYDYDTIGNGIKTVTYNWDSSVNTWVGFTSEESIYKANGDVFINSYYWLESDTLWVPTTSDKKTFTLNNDGKILEELDYTWDSGTNTWTGTRFTTYAYDSYGYEKNINIYIWEQSVNTWVGNTMITYVYDSLGNQTESAVYYWNNDSLSWQGSIRSVSTFDINGRFESNTVYSWEKGAWLAGIKTSDIYSAEYNNTLKTYFSLKSMFTNTLDTITVFNYYYSNVKVTDIVDEKAMVQVSGYPNPTNGLIYLKTNGIASVSIYNSLGEIMYSTTVSENDLSQADLSSHPPGIYYLKAISNNKSSVQKIIKY